MARTTALKPKKKATVRATRRLSGFALAPTDTFWKAKHFVHYEIESREWSNKIKEYVKRFLPKTDAAHINRLPEWKTANYSHWAITAHWLLNNLAPPTDYVNGFKRYLDGLIEEGKEVAKKDRAAEKTAKSSAPVPTIQERIADQAAEAMEDIEAWLEGFVTDKTTFDPKGFDFTAHFAKYKVTQAHARKIMSNYQSELEEVRLIQNLPTPQTIAKIKDEREKDMAQQLREGYSHLSKKDAQAYLTALETLVGACMLVIDTSKATRKPRVKKAPSKDKIVAKLKFKAMDEKYQLASVNPLDLIGAAEIWVFNIKTRKLGKYVAAEDASVMTVKGSALIGYDEEKSVQKTLRKPEETLKEFKAAGKIKLRRFLDEIKTTDTKLSGRINEDTILLKAL
jgi:hypothetical protein